MTWDYKDRFGETVKVLGEFDAYGVEERDALIELAQMAEESAQVELEVFGCIEFEEATSPAEYDEDGIWEAIWDIDEFMPFELY